MRRGYAPQKTGNWQKVDSETLIVANMLLFRSHPGSSAKDIPTAEHLSFCEEGTEDD